MPAFAALAALAAAFVALARPAAASARVERILAVLAALAMVPSLEEASSWPAVALVAGAAVFATPLPCLFGAAAAALVALAGPAAAPAALGAPVLAALAFSAGAASVDSEGGAWLRSGADRAWPAALAGLALCLAVALPRRHEALFWRLSLGAPEQLVPIPGAGILLGLALVVTLAGALALAAHLLTPAIPSAPMRQFGQRALVLGAGLAILAAGFAMVRGSVAPEALASSGSQLVGLMLAAAGLAAALVVLIGSPPSGEPQPFAVQGVLEARIGAGLTVAAAGMAGFEGWSRSGTYATPLTVVAASAALLALAVLEPTRLGLSRKVLWLLALAFVVAA
jgi:hypothetical protein